MISVAKALAILKTKVTPRTTSERILVEDSLGRILFEAILAPIPLPPFRQSVMDGYALHLHDSLEYTVVGEVKTGDSHPYVLQPGEAVRIFTGAWVPDTANAVMMQEKVTVQENSIVLSENPSEGNQIREIGQQIANGAKALSKGMTLNPSAIGLLKSFGITEVSVTKTPKVSILVTGNELVSAGNALPPGKIYESNSTLMAAALQQKGIQPHKIRQVPDSIEATETALAELLESSDVILVSGGISVGDYDFVGKALTHLGVQEHFYKVAQKPGKPLYFGSKDQTYVLGLPGNPASTLTCLYVYGYSLIDQLCGRNQPGLTSLELPTAMEIKNPFGRALFLKALVEGNRVTELTQQNSSMVLSFTEANALIYIPENCTKVTSGSLVKIYLLP